MKTTLKFPNIQHLIDFEMEITTEHCFINRTQLTIYGLFTPAEIVIGVKDFKAEVIEESNAL